MGIYLFLQNMTFGLVRWCQICQNGLGSVTFMWVRFMAPVWLGDVIMGFSFLVAWAPVWLGIPMCRCDEANRHIVQLLVVNV